MKVCEFIENIVSVDVPEMDAQHREYARLIAAVKKFEDGELKHMTLMDVLEELMAFSQYHFKSEENLMREAGYPEFKEHKVVHDDLMIKLHDALRDIGRPSFNLHEFYMFVCDWVLEHTTGHDVELGKFIVEHRTSA